MAQGPSRPAPDLGFPPLSWGGPAGSVQGEQGRQAGRQAAARGGGPTLTQNPEGTYRACKLDPRVDRLRPGVPHSVHQPDRRPAGPGRRSLPAGVGLQRAGSGQAGVRGRTQQVSMSRRVGAGQVSRAGVCARGGLSASGAGGQKNRRRAGGAAVGAGLRREGACAASNWTGARLPQPGEPQPRPRPRPGHAQGHSLSTAPSQRSPPLGHCLEAYAPSCPWWSSRLLGGGRGDPEAGTEMWLSLSAQGVSGEGVRLDCAEPGLLICPHSPCWPPGPQLRALQPPSSGRPDWLDSDPSLAGPPLAP